MKRTAFFWIASALALLATLACAGPALPVVFRASTATPRPTRTPRPSFTPTPSDTPTPSATPLPTRTPTGTATPTALPPTVTNTPPPTDTPPPPPPPTNTPRPRPTNTPAPPPPTATPSTEFTGRIGDITPASYSCSTAFIAARVVDRGGNPLPGYYIHIGQDGNFSQWSPTTAVAKDPYGYNASYDIMTSAPLKLYITVTRQGGSDVSYDPSLVISNEITVNVDAKDENACAASDGKNDGTGVRIVPVVFVYNR